MVRVNVKVKVRVRVRVQVRPALDTTKCAGVLDGTTGNSFDAGFLS